MALLLAAAATPVAAQDFPAPGTGALTWEIFGRPLQYNAIQFGTDGTLYVGGWDSLYVFDPAAGSTLEGRWRSLGVARGGVDAVFPLDAAGDTLLAGAVAGGRLNRSTDHGVTWAMVNGPRYVTGSGGPERPGGFLIIPLGKPHAGRILAGGDLMYSDDRGATWVQSGSPLPPGDVNAGAFLSLPSGRVLAAGYWGVLASDNVGGSYTRTAIFAPYGFLGDGLAALATPGSPQSGVPNCGQTEPGFCDGAVAVIGGRAASVRTARATAGGRGLRRCSYRSPRTASASAPHQAWWRCRRVRTVWGERWRCSAVGWCTGRWTARRHGSLSVGCRWTPRVTIGRCTRFWGRMATCG